jgi:hypothetical protein
VALEIFVFEILAGVFVLAEEFLGEITGFSRRMG